MGNRVRWKVSYASEREEVNESGEKLRCVELNDLYSQFCKYACFVSANFVIMRLINLCPLFAVTRTVVYECWLLYDFGDQYEGIAP